MKKWFIILLTLVIFCSPVILGGCSMLDGKSEKEKMIEIAKSKKMKRALEKFLKELDPKALTPEGKIQSYKILEDKLKYNPMGGVDIYLSINGREGFDIDMTVQEELGKYRVVSYGISQGLTQVIRGR